MSSTPVPHPAAGVPVRRLNLRQGTDTLLHPEMVDLTSSTATGRVGDWVVHTQRRGQGGQSALCVRIDAPDGRVLFVAANLSSSSTNSRGPASTLFGGNFGRVFKERRTEVQETQASGAVAGAFETAWAMESDPANLPYQSARLQAGSGLLTEDQFDAWWQNWHFALMERHVTMNDLATLHHGGFDPAQAMAWFSVNEDRLVDSNKFHTYVHGTPLDARGVSTARAKTWATFAASGWSLRQIKDLMIALELEHTANPATSWAALVPETAMLAVRAGLGPREAMRLFRAGRLDDDTLRAMAALRAGTEDLTVY